MQIYYMISSNLTSLPVSENCSTSHHISNHVSLESLSPQFRAFTSSLLSVDTPNHWKNAMQDPKWKATMLEEMHALKKNGTWELVPRPTDKRVVGCKGVYTVKKTPEGNIDRYKSRLVAKGYTQTYGVDYEKTFSSVAKMNTVRILLSCAANLDWTVHQLDVKNAFLHGDLKEEVYMEIPPGFEDAKTVGKVCRLKRSLYGLKQSP